MAVIVFIVFIWLCAEAVKDAHSSPGGGRGAPGGGPRLPQYGAVDHLRDRYRDSWRRATDDLVAKRDRRADRRRASGRDDRSWWQRAQDRYADRQQERRRRREEQRQHETHEPTPTPQPQRPLFPDPTPKPAPEAPPAGPDPPEPDAQVIRFRPRVVTDPPTPQPETPDEPTGTPDSPTTPSTKGADMSGEVLDHETHIAELDRTIAELEAGIDLCDVVISTSSALRGQVDDLQSKYGPVAAATQTRADHLQALHVDQTTAGHAAEGADALDPNAVARYHDEAEAIEAGAKSLRERLEKALELAKAERAEAIRRYADAQETVKNDLSGDATYLGGNGGTSTATAAPAPQQQPEPAGATR